MMKLAFFNHWKQNKNKQFKNKDSARTILAFLKIDQLKC